MKVILSRKGFDSENGGCASPVLPDGTLLSMPIPVKGRKNDKFEDLSYKKHSYADIYRSLHKRMDSKYCHLDPDIRKNVRNNKVDKWKAAFGQCETAQGHLINQGVGIGDLFLFFGWFKEAELVGNKYCYKKDANDLHIIYGYLQIGDILKGDDIKKYWWHPHAKKDNIKSDTLYVPSKKLIIDGEDMGLPGYGTLGFANNLVLTKSGCNRTEWKLLPWMKQAKISFNKNSVDEDKNCFKSASRGQEFVIEDKKSVTNWAKKLIISNYNNR